MLAAADQLFDLDRDVVEISLGQVVEVVVSLAGVQQITGDHRVERQAGQLDAGGAEHDHVVLQVLPDLLDRRIFQHRPQGVQRGACGSRWFCPAGARSGRYQPSCSFQANDMPTISAQRGQTLVVSVSTETRVCRRSSAEESGELLGRVNQVMHRLGGAPAAFPRLARRAICRSFSARLRKPNSSNNCQRPATVGAVQPRGPPIDRQRHVGVQSHELAAEEGLLA